MMPQRVRHETDSSWQQSFIALVVQRTAVDLRQLTAPAQAFVGERASSMGLGDEHAYVTHLGQLDSSDSEWTLVIDTVTNGLTQFFRDAEQLEVVGQLMLEAQGHSPYRPLRLWSAGCSTGEEAYTLAMLAHRLGLSPTPEVLGSDINEAALDRARLATYDVWSVRQLNQRDCRTFFDKVDGRLRVAEGQRRKVNFVSNNLARGAPPLPSQGYWDVILCRNVLIYYDPPAIARILTSMASVLAPEGWIILGASESIRRLKVPLLPHQRGGRVAYSKASRPEGGQRTTGDRGTGIGVAHRLSGSLAATDLRVAAVARRVSDLSETQPNAQEPSAKQGHCPHTTYSDVAPVVRAHLDEDDITAAIAALTEVIGVSPADLVARLTLGHCFLAQHKFGQAALAYNEAQRLDGLCAEAHFFLGVVARRQGQLGAAVASFRKAVFLHPTFWLASYYLASSAARVGDQETVVREQRRTTEILQSSSGSIPFITEPVAHSRFVPDPREVLEVCVAGFELKRGH